MSGGLLIAQGEQSVLKFLFRSGGEPSAQKLMLTPSPFSMSM